jgi:hypothetical protein
MIHPFGWRDIPILYRYRDQGVYLSSALQVTRGPALISATLLSLLTSSTGLYTWVCSDDQVPLIGQSLHAASMPFARVVFLAPETTIEHPRIQELLEQLAHQTGKQGAFILLAEIETDAPLYETLRRAGFAAYARQRIWRLANESPGLPNPRIWRIARPIDEVAIQTLHRKILPESVANIEPLQTTPIQGYVIYQDTELMGYAEIKYGAQGIWIHPYFHPDVDDLDRVLSDLIHGIPERRSRPLNLCVRAYQALLAPALEDLGAGPGPEQTAMVKRLAAHHKLRETFKLPNLEGKTKPSAPLAQSRRNS